MRSINDFDGRWFRFVNWSGFPLRWVNYVHKIADSIQNRIPQQIRCEKYNGSYSFIADGKTVGKLAPESAANPHLMVGFSVVVPTAGRFAKNIGEPEDCVLGPGKEKFVMAPSDPVTEKDAICENMVKFLKDALELEWKM